MSYQERRAAVAIFGTFIISGGFAAYMLPRHPAGDPYAPAVFQFWGSYFVVLILVSIVVRILISIAFTILNTIVTREKEPGLTDERDQLIELRTTRIGFFIFILGFVIAMLMLAAGQPPPTMFVILLLSGIASELANDIAEFVSYRRGF